MLTDCREKKWLLRKRFLTPLKDWVAQQEKNHMIMVMHR